jgi:hypothetical protein
MTGTGTISRKESLADILKRRSGGAQPDGEEAARRLGWVPLR